MDDRIFSSNDTTTNSFFRPYLKTSEKNETEKDNELSQTKRKYNNTSNSIDEQPYKRVCKAEKFEAIKYSLGPNEEYIAIRRCEYDDWERNEDRMSIIQEFFTEERQRMEGDAHRRKITLRVGKERIIFKSVKPASSLIKRVYMLSLRERMELDLEAMLMGETLVINRSLDPLNGDYIELNDLNEPFELRRNQGNDSMPTIEEGEVIEEFKARNDARMVCEIFRYPSDYDHDKKIRIDYAYNLKFSCMIGFEFLHANFFPILYVNVMSKKFHNSIMKEKLEYKGNNVVGALMNVPIFVRTFSVMTDFTVLEDMDDYRNEGMGDVIFSEPFLREVGIKARRIDGMITIYNGNDEVSEEDKMNGISYEYQKLKGFYKGVLNLGPDYIRDEKMEEWLTSGHIGVHEMEW
ncbi:hypothetical protein Tco_1093451 [Tanacetum coccineum]|uniref:Uncharacterized protein n=1 Tax=Tanacetum coccineum TaxID=301880 RepID=A0ABQ5ICT0_9ASTR